MNNRQLLRFLHSVVMVMVMVMVMVVVVVVVMMMMMMMMMMMVVPNYWKTADWFMSPVPSCLFQQHVKVGDDLQGRTLQAGKAAILQMKCSSAKERQRHRRLWINFVRVQ